MMPLPRLRMRIFITSQATNTALLWCHLQLLQHGEMPLPTLEGMQELVATNNPEASKITVHRVTVHDNPDECEAGALGHKLFYIQMEVMKLAERDNLAFEIHIFDNRTRSGRARPGLPKIPITSPTLNPAVV